MENGTGVRKNNANDINAKKNNIIEKTVANGRGGGFLSKIISCLCCPSNVNVGPELLQPPL